MTTTPRKLAWVALSSRYLVPSHFFLFYPSHFLLLLTGHYVGRSGWEGGRGPSLLRGWQDDQPQHLGEAGQYRESYVFTAAGPWGHPWRKLRDDEEDQGQWEEEPVRLSDYTLLIFSGLQEKKKSIVPQIQPSSDGNVKWQCHNLWQFDTQQNSWNALHDRMFFLQDIYLIKNTCYLRSPSLLTSRRRQREEKLREQSEKQKERMRRYMERSLADSKKIVSHLLTNCFKQCFMLFFEFCMTTSKHHNSLSVYILTEAHGVSLYNHNWIYSKSKTIKQTEEQCLNCSPFSFRVGESSCPDACLLPRKRESAMWTTPLLKMRSMPTSSPLRT